MTTFQNKSSGEEESDRLSQLPNDDFGTVRERRDFSPMEITRTPILPSPYRDHSFTSLTGFRYHPTANPDDRLGIRLEGVPSTTMTIPDSWNDYVIDHSRAIESTRRQLEKLEALERFKRRKIFGEEAAAAFVLDPGLVVGNSSTTSQPIDTLHTTVDNGITDVKNVVSSSIDDVTMATESTSASYSTMSVKANSVEVLSSTAAHHSQRKDVDVEMASPDVIPKKELYLMYGKKPFKVQLKSSDYVTWDNGKSGQELRFSSAFLCPVTHEIFLAGRYLETPCEQCNGLTWYTRKNMAEHAAAARAIDCWHKREGKHHKKRLSPDSPYHPGDVPALPMRHLSETTQEIIKAAVDRHEVWQGSKDRKKVTERFRLSPSKGRHQDEPDKSLFHSSKFSQGKPQGTGSEFLSERQRERHDRRGYHHDYAEEHHRPSSRFESSSPSHYDASRLGIVNSCGLRCVDRTYNPPTDKRPASQGHDQQPGETHRNYFTKYYSGQDGSKRRSDNES